MLIVLVIMNRQIIYVYYWTPISKYEDAQRAYNYYKYKANQIEEYMFHNSIDPLEIYGSIMAITTVGFQNFYPNLCQDQGELDCNHYFSFEIVKIQKFINRYGYDLYMHFSNICKIIKSKKFQEPNYSLIDVRNKSQLKESYGTCNPHVPPIHNIFKEIKCKHLILEYDKNNKHYKCYKCNIVIVNNSKLPR